MNRGENSLKIVKWTGGIKRAGGEIPKVVKWAGYVKQAKTPGSK